MKRKIFSVLFTLVLVASFSLVTAVPVFAAATGNIADNNLGAQVIAASSIKCVQKVTITNPGGAGDLDIDCFAVTNGGSAVDADVTQVAVYHDTNGTPGTWDATDALIGTAANFAAATAIGANNDVACLSVVKDTTEVVFVVVTTAAVPTNGNTFLTTIDGIDLVGASTDTWTAPPAAQATATSATTIDTVAPIATVTTAVDPIFEGALVQTVIVTYDESMDPATTPGITLTGLNWLAQTNVGWSLTVFPNDTFTATFTHDGTQEEIAAEVATVATGSGATDVAGNADVGDASPPFVVDTQKPTATVTTAVDPIYEGALVQTVIVTYDESMDPATTPGITLTGLNWLAQTNVGWSQTAFVNDTFTATFTHDGTQEEIAAEVATVASGSGATDVAGNADVGDASPPFVVDTQKPTVAITSTVLGPTNTSPIPMTATFSEDVTGFVVGDITVGNGAAGNFVAVSGTVYTFDVTPAAQGVVTVDIAAAVAQDAAGNDNTVAPQFSITYIVTVTVYGGEWAPPTPTIETYLLFGQESDFSITSEGEIIDTIQATSEDGMLTMTIPKGTIALDENGDPLSTLTADVSVSPPPLPEEANIIGLAYDFGPDGATFDPPITLQFEYDPSDVPEGINEKDLVLAYYNTETGQWVELDCVVDTKTHTITANKLSHFTIFALIVPPAPEPEPAPAAFSVTDLSIQPTEVQPKEAVTITVSVANTGGTEDSYSVVLMINGVKEVEKSVTVAAGSSQDVSFSATKEEAGSYSVVVDGLSGSFTVAAPAPAPAPAPPTPEVKPPINWPLIGGSIAGVIVVIVLITLLVRRRAH